MYTYIYVYIYIYTHVYIYIYTHVYIYVYIYIYMNGGWRTQARRPPGIRGEMQSRNPVLQSQSYTSKGTSRQGIGSFGKKLTCFSTMPCRHMPLLAQL